MPINIISLTQPATKVHVFVPNNTTVLPLVVSGLIVSAAGNIKITDQHDVESIMVAVPVGILPVAAKIVHSDSTTATVTTALGH